MVEDVFFPGGGVAAGDSAIRRGDDSRRVCVAEHQKGDPPIRSHGLIRCIPTVESSGGSAVATRVPATSAFKPAAAPAESAHALRARLFMTQDRAALRRELRRRRRALPAAERIAAAERLADRLCALPFACRSGRVAGYWAMDGEIPLHAWQLRLPPAVVYCLPVLHEDGRLRFAPWRPGASLVTNRYGIPEPDVSGDALLAADAMDFVVVPLVAFDARGHRLGMGAGWYDRSFAFRSACGPSPWLVGAGFAAQHVDVLAPESWDIALDAVCTEHDTFLTAAAPA